MQSETMPTMSLSTTLLWAHSLPKEGTLFFFFLTFLYIHFLTALSLLVCEKTYFSFFSTRLDFYVRILYRHFLLRDVYDDMMLDGVQPTRDVFHSLIVGTMKGVRLQDGFYFKDQMKTTGLLPDVCVFFFLFEL